MSFAALVEQLADPAATAATLAANLLIQSAVLIAAGLLLARAARRRGAAVQSAIVRATLGAVVLCPLASVLLGAAGGAGLSVNLPRPAGPRMPDPPSLDVPAAPLPIDTADRAIVERMPFDIVAEDGVAGPPETDTSARPVAGPIHETLSAMPVEAMPPDAIDRLAILYASLAGAWIAIAAVLLFRLGVCHLLLTRARRSAQPAERNITDAARALAAELGVRPAPVRITRHVATPCLTGLLRPIVLLPESTPTATREVLVHELAHMGRHDCLWNLLSRITTALLWFQPLAWLLIRRIEQTADDVCDDHVVRHSPDRPAYARQLVDLAEHLRPRPAETTAALGVVTFKSALARRVVRILDSSRALSLRVTARSVLFIGVGAACAAGLAGIVRSGERPEAPRIYRPPKLLYIGWQDDDTTRSSTATAEISITGPHCVSRVWDASGRLQEGPAVEGFLRRNARLGSDPRRTNRADPSDPCISSSRTAAARKSPGSR